MAWTELSVEVPRGDVDRVSGVFFAHGAAGVQEDFLPGQAPPPRQPWDTGAPPPAVKQRVVKAWFQEPDLDGIRAALAPYPVHTAAVPDTDWDAAWRESFVPLVVDDTLTIAAPWDAPAGALLIEPGQGFGTGQHPTTLALMRWVNQLAPAATSMLDLGCGSGILALVAARHGADVHGVDIDPAAVRDAHRNAELNGLAGRFDTTPIPDLREPAELVAANIYAEVLVQLAADLVRLTKRDLVLAGIIDDREHLVRSALDPHLALHDRVVDGEWVALHYTRRS